MLRDDDDELNRDPRKGIVGMDLRAVARVNGLMLLGRDVILVVAFEKV